MGPGLQEAGDEVVSHRVAGVHECQEVTIGADDKLRVRRNGQIDVMLVLGIALVRKTSGASCTD